MSDWDSVEQQGPVLPGGNSYVTRADSSASASKKSSKKADKDGGDSDSYWSKAKHVKVTIKRKNLIQAFKPSKHNQKSKNAEDGPRKLEERGDEAGALEGKEEEGEEEEEEEEEESSEESLLPPAEIIPVPPMRICMLIVGTRGDVQPFVALGKRLQQKGHYVRLATHDMYKDIVHKAGLSFYPLGGDPKKLSEWMVKTTGRLIPNFLDKEEITVEVPAKMRMIRDILESTWPACTKPDPYIKQMNSDVGSDDDKDLTPVDKEKWAMEQNFRADAVISNPVSYGHIHVAEALSIPLHMMFPQPWVPTKSFPHPFSTTSKTQMKEWSSANKLTYAAVDSIMWAGVGSLVNTFRSETLKLHKIRALSSGYDLLNRNKVPYALLWSPAFVPKTKDWGKHVDVVGTLAPPAQDFSDYKPPDDLDSFLKAGDPPVFIGFGSMVIADTSSLVKIILQAATRTKTRVVLQSSWSNLGLDESSDSDHDPGYLCMVGSAPHDWLFPRMSAVVHHGGAGTVAAGLKYGKPTFICPFFGDQFFWGEMVFRRGVGCKPCPIAELTAETLAERLNTLKDPEIKASAEKLAVEMNKEDGIETVIDVFYKHIPIDKMVCDVSIFMEKTALATRTDPRTGIKVSAAVDEIIHKKFKNLQPFKPYKFQHYSAETVENVWDGLVSGVGGMTDEVFRGVSGVFTKPVSGAKKHGPAGFVSGVGKGIFGLVTRPVKGAYTLFDKIGTGAANTTREQNINLHRPPKLGNVQMRILQREPSTKLSVKTDTAEPEPLPDEQTIKAVVQAYQKCLAAYELFREYGSRGGQSIGGKKAVELFEKLMGCSIDQEGVKAAVLADGKVTFSEFCALVKDKINSKMAIELLKPCAEKKAGSEANTDAATATST